MSPFGFLKKHQPEAEEWEKTDRGFLVFENTSEVIQEAAMVAARTNRLAGSYAHPTPATQVMEIIRCIPEALRAFMKEGQWKTKKHHDSQKR